MKLTTSELKDFLEQKHDEYNSIKFIESDPISIPHQFTKKEDIEIAGFLTATIAWGQRVTIIKNATKMMRLMNNNPHEFVLNATKNDLKRFDNFVHRTFNGIDAIYFIKSLQNIYTKHNGLAAVFMPSNSVDFIGNEYTVLDAISKFRTLFFSIESPARTYKHVSNPAVNSSAKRICMYLRWMIRNDKRGVDFGLWKNNQLNSPQLMCPLDVHSGNVARKLGLLKRNQNDWKAVEELTANLKKFDPKDPVKYDFALFGLGIEEQFQNQTI
jgi:uncharacterized protein (TIGR02757 family)